MRKSCPILDTKRQGRVAEEAPQQLRTSSHAPPLTTHMAVDVLDGVRSEVREAAVFEVAPAQLHGIEFWRVRQKPDDAKATMGPPATRARGGAGGSGRGPTAG